MSMNMHDPEREYERRQPRPDQVDPDEPLGQPADPTGPGEPAGPGDLTDPGDVANSGSPATPGGPGDPQHPVDGDRPVDDFGGTADLIIGDPLIK